MLGFSLPSGLFLDVESKLLFGTGSAPLAAEAVTGQEIDRPTLAGIPAMKLPGGLVRRHGRMGLFQHLGQPYARFLDRAVSHRLDIGLLEQRALGFSHTKLSARLCGGGAFRNALRLHCLAAFRRRAKGRSPRFASERVDRPVVRRWPTSALPELYDAGHDYCRHIDQQSEPLVPVIEEKVNELADIFSLALPDGLEYRDVRPRPTGN